VKVWKKVIASVFGFSNDLVFSQIIKENKLTLSIYVHLDMTTIHAWHAHFNLGMLVYGPEARRESSPKNNL
jgi:hypothetical protein